MRLRDVFRESGANLVAEGWLLPVAAGLMFSFAFVGAALELDVTKQTVEIAQSLQAAGSAVWVANATNISPIAADACLDMRKLSAVKRVAGMARSQSAATRRAPDARFAVNRFVGDLPTILSNTRNQAVDAFTSKELAAQLGLGKRLPALLDAGRVLRNLEAIDLSVRVVDPGSKLWIRNPDTADLDRCYVEFHQRDETQPHVIHAALDRPGIHFPVHSLIGSDRFRADPLASYLNRPTRFLWLVTGAISGLLLAIPQLFRRHWIALYKSVGASHASAFLITVLPTIPLLAGATVSGASAALLWTLHETRLDRSDFLAGASRFAALHLAASLLVVIAVVTGLTMGDPSKQLRRTS